jgi:hypothetical protein
MSSLQTFLVIGGLAMVAVLGMNFFRSSSYQVDNKLRNEASITATAFGRSVYQLMNRMSFDEASITKLISKPSELSSKSIFGPGQDPGESSLADFDDVDDFDGYVFTQTFGGLGEFFAKISVNYASNADLTTISSSKTFVKRVDIKVTNQYLKNENSQPDTLKLTYAFTF